MSNLDSAKSAVADELAKAKEGAAFYTQRIAALEEMIRNLAVLDGSSSTSEAPKKRGRKPGTKVAQPTKAKRGRPAKTTASSVGENVVPVGKTKSTGKKKLPSTKGDFWKNQITSEHRSWSEILDGAIANLGISPTADDRKKLQQRMIFAINTLVKAGEIKDSGAGRERRFFK